MSIEDFPIKPFGAETPDRLLKAFNKNNDTEEVLIIGIDKDGSISISSSYEDGLKSLGLIEIAKQALLNEWL